MKKKDILVCIHLLLLFFAMYYTYDGNKTAGCIYLVCMVFGIFLLGKRIPIQGGFVLIGACMEGILLVLFHRHLIECVIFTVALLIASISFTLDASKERRPIFLEITPVWMVFLLLCHAPLYFTGYPSKYLRIIGVLYALLYVLSLAVDNMEDFKKMHSGMEYLPVVQLGKAFFFSVCSVLLWIFFCMILGKNQWLSDYICQKIQRFLNRMNDVELRITPEEVSMPMAPLQDGMVQMLPKTALTGAETTQKSKIIGYMLGFFLLLLCLVLVLFALYSLYCYLKRNKTDEEDEIEFIKDNIPEEYLYLGDRKQEKPKRKLTSANELIRRKYRKRIKGTLHKKIPLWATPKELESLAEWEQSGKDRELHRLYEKARYSKEGCQMEEFDRYNNSDDKND